MLVYEKNWCNSENEIESLAIRIKRINGESKRQFDNKKRMWKMIEE